ncbi:MAG: hypothetical protein ABR592_00710 [Nitriliruptorales bacterium]
MSDRYIRAEEMSRARRLDKLEAEIERLREAIRQAEHEMHERRYGDARQTLSAALDD